MAATTTGTTMTTPANRRSAGLPAFDYRRTPEDIYAASFAAVRAATDLSHLPDDLHPLAMRLVHACAMPDIIDHLRFSPDAVRRGAEALAGGAPVLVDAHMVGAGVTRLGPDNAVLCAVGEPSVADAARRTSTTRSAAAMDHLRPHLGGAVVAIGNAPTALFRLLELIAEGAPPPAFVAAFPVGFIGAAESKDALVAHAGDLAYVTLLGRRGGSALAAAAVNALAETPA
jgi:precorrin-8X/cobalt-precorrin-8 methylmutase